MEALLFVADIACMIALGFALVRSARTGTPGLGIFRFKEVRVSKDEQRAKKDSTHA
jgi:hypothetical protein